MSSPKKLQFFDFDFDFDLSMDKIFPASEIEQNPFETNPHQPDLSRQSTAIGDPNRCSGSTGVTLDLPITPEPSISGKDVESSLSSRGEIASKSGDRDNESTVPQSMIVYEAQTANSRGEVARQARRLRSVVDQESQVPGQPRQRDKSGKTLLFKVRVIGRIMQVFLSTLVLILVGLTISTVTATSDPAQTNEQQLWSPSIELTPEYLIAITSGVSITLSLRNLPRHTSLTPVGVVGIFVIQNMCETRGGLSCVIDPGINIILLVVWLVAAVLFKQNSNDNFVWGYSCSDSSDANQYVNYDIVCSRETATWAISIISAILEFLILTAFTLTILRGKMIRTDCADGVRVSKLRKPVQRTMMEMARHPEDDEASPRPYIGWTINGQEIHVTGGRLARK